MSFLGSFLKCRAALSAVTTMEPASALLSQFQQIRNKWPNARMKKDARKRNTLKELGVYKLRYNAVRKNNVLPSEIREIADKETAACHIDTSPLRTVTRCALTSRPRGTVVRWRLSRLVFRHMADYNKLSGIQRALW